MRRKLMMLNLFCTSNLFLTNIISCSVDNVKELQYKEGKNNNDVVKLLNSNLSYISSSKEKIEIANGKLKKDYFDTDYKLYYDEFGREIIEDKMEGTLIYIDGQSTVPNKSTLSSYISDIFIGLDTLKNELIGTIFDGNLTTFSLSIKGKKDSSELELFVLKLNYTFNSEYSSLKGVKILQKQITLI
ncbi:hypothetical protein [Spiroplasma turonicum]|uniref:Uncharacterized protein n=1 Tax=Spiroplasma turonicum TaxID=216946 RepID=A0A0K1P5X3_9MOLU|nr:hypothetical protein [Spiroplasma turonicum]AKU79660.1 hypothetical protein STURON_00414 [Spiroplasma turonicum]ALX70680.1 hypothetical protein STURO_v1c04120 [Spiroplasma turonicum]